MLPFILDQEELAEDRIGDLLDGEWGGSESVNAMSVQYEVPIHVHDEKGQITHLGNDYK
ncbi:MAG: hypothetical protein EZS28_054410, partial [Streblomastix strix]